MDQNYNINLIYYYSYQDLAMITDGSKPRLVVLNCNLLHQVPRNLQSELKRRTREVELFNKYEEDKNTNSQTRIDET